MTTWIMQMFRNVARLGNKNKDSHKVFHASNILVLKAAKSQEVTTWKLKKKRKKLNIRR